MDDKRASEMGALISQKRKLNESGLVTTGSVPDNYISTYANATLGILYYLTKSHGDAKRIRDSLIKEIGYKKNLLGFNTNLIKKGTKDSSVMTLTNSQFGVLEYLLGNENQAGKIKEEIITKIKFNDGMIREGIDYPCIDLKPNIGFATLNYFLGFRERAVRMRDEIIRNYGGNYQKFIAEVDKYSVSNFATLEYLLGNENQARKIREDLEEDYSESDKNISKNSYELASWGILQVAEKLKRIYEARKK